MYVPVKCCIHYYVTLVIIVSAISSKVNCFAFDIWTVFVMSDFSSNVVKSIVLGVLGYAAVWQLFSTCKVDFIEFCWFLSRKIIWIKVKKNCKRLHFFGKQFILYICTICVLNMGRILKCTSFLHSAVKWTFINKDHHKMVHWDDTTKKSQIPSTQSWGKKMGILL